MVSGSLQTERLADGRRKLLRDLTIEINNTQYNVPKGFVTDFSSVPWFGRFVVRWSKIDIAGVVHDYLYDHGTGSRSSADWVWYQIAISGPHRANLLQAWICWISLVLFGWTAWNSSRQTPLSKRLPLRLALAVITICVCWFGWRIYESSQHKSDQAEWTRQFRSRGANVLMNAYGGGPLMRVPVLQQLSVYTQFEVVLPNSKVAHECSDLLQTCPHIDRLWIHKLNVDSDTVIEVQELVPDADTIRYTGNL